jgi:adenosylmethionine-8-amino-7-oxononanoate aminotransferase
LFLSIEFVLDRQTKATFPSQIQLSRLLDDAIFARGTSIYSGFGKGTADGVRGDHILFSPPLNISSDQVHEMVFATKEGVEEVFRLQEVQEAVASASRS